MHRAAQRYYALTGVRLVRRVGGDIPSYSILEEKREQGENRAGCENVRKVGIGGKHDRFRETDS